MKRTLNKGALALTALMVLILSNCGGGAKKRPTVMSAIIPNADVVAYFEGKSISNSLFLQEIADSSSLLEMYRRANKDRKKDVEWAKIEQKFGAFLDDLGLRGKDIVAVVISLRFKNSALDDPGKVKSGFSVAIELAQAVSPEKLKSALEKSLPEGKGKIQMEGKYLKFTPTDGGGSYEGAARGGKLHFWAESKPQLLAALAGSNTSLPPAFESTKAGLPPGSNIWIVFKTGQTIQGKLKKALEIAKAKGQKDPLAKHMMALLQPLQSLQNGSVGLNIAEDFTVALSLNFGSPDDAKKANYILNGYLNLGKGLLAIYNVNVSFVNTLKAEIKDATITVSVRFTIADIQVLEKVAKVELEKAAQPAASPSGP